MFKPTKIENSFEFHLNQTGSNTERNSSTHLMQPNPGKEVEDTLDPLKSRVLLIHLAKVNHPKPACR